MNSFCIECTGGDRDEVRKCGDRNCPFYLERAANLEWQNDRQEREEAYETIR